MLAISGDSPACHAAFAAARKFPFPLLSDLHRSVIGQAGDRQMVRDGAEILRVLELIGRLR